MNFLSLYSTQPWTFCYSYVKLTNIENEFWGPVEWVRCYHATGCHSTLRLVTLPANTVSEKAYSSSQLTQPGFTMDWVISHCWDKTPNTHNLKEEWCYFGSWFSEDSAHDSEQKWHGSGTQWKKGAEPTAARRQREKAGAGDKKTPFRFTPLVTTSMDESTEM